MVALLQNTTSLRQALIVWRIFCTVLNSRKKTPAVKKTVKKMNTMFKDASLQSVDSDEDDICTEDLGESGLIGKDKIEKLGIRDRSPFKPIFIQHLVEEENEDNDEVVENIYYQKELIHHIGHNYMPLYPLWSGCMLEEGKTRDSNASVESWMKIVKKDILIGKKNLRIGEYVRTLRPVVGGRLRKVVMKQGEKRIRKTKKRKLPAEDIEKAEEAWAKKSKGKERTGFLYSPAKTVPVPKVKEKTGRGQQRKKPVQTSEGRKGRDRNPAGLVNKGNTCWLNSTLQAVAAMKQLKCEGDDRICGAAKVIIDQIRNFEDLENPLDPDDLRVSKAEEETNLVSVELASVKPASVSSCLLEFGKEEILTEEDAPLCTNCKKNTTHSTQTSITRAEGLLISLKRFRLAKSGRHVKDNRAIRVISVIGLKNVGVYRLCAVQCHLGSSMERGHYVTVTNDDEWTLRCDDSDIKVLHNAALNGKEVLSSAYVLYYGQTSMKDARSLIEKCKDVTVAFCGEIELIGQDVSTLLPDKRLNGQVINAYMFIITDKYRNTTAVDVFFSHCLMRGTNPDIYMKDDQVKRAKILVPFIYKNHWTLLVIYPNRHVILVYDSMVGGSDEPTESLRQYMTNRDGVTYGVINMKGLPRQMNDSDCGVFMCQFARSVAMEADITFNQENIKSFRKKMIFECLASSLL